ncbi:DNA primase large subunit Spp2 [Entomophthora muscae]|uniref:DNA primase large subunit Spp2 n=1 Tax=Entomophthora muscae TaxID=34485 RepID=A0ACC2RXP0_9FUNG|nr:DNA primase large subunit Spp2 [Entomophthora muscae]
MENGATHTPFKNKTTKVLKPVLGFEIEEKPKQDIELITGFSKKKVISATPKVKTGPLVIPFKGYDQGWRHKRGVNYIPPGASQANGEVVTVAKMEAADPSTYGLQIREKGSEMEDLAAEPLTEDKPQKVMTLEEEAAAALIDDANGVLNSDKKIDIIPLSLSSKPRSEAELFKDDIDSRPDECTLEDYERVPVQDFGEALLRGMGWKDGEPIGLKKRGGTYEAIGFERRERLLGLGAKPKPPHLDPNKKKPRR